MTTREDFGEPLASDVLLGIGLLYFNRGLVVTGIRAYFSGIPRDVAMGALEALLIEFRRNADEL